MNTEVLMIFKEESHSVGHASHAELNGRSVPDAVDHLGCDLLVDFRDGRIRQFRDLVIGFANPGDIVNVDEGIFGTENVRDLTINLDDDGLGQARADVSPEGANGT